MTKRKGTKGQTTIYKTYTKLKRESNTNPTKYLPIMHLYFGNCIALYLTLDCFHYILNCTLSKTNQIITRRLNQPEMTLNIYP
jgi:hypothetical protein